MTGEDIIIVIDERTIEPVVVEGGEYYRGPAGADGHTPYIGENGNWWINGEDTGVNGTAPNMSVVEQYVTGYAEPKRGIDDFFVTNAQVILINDIINKVTAITGHSLVADTEIAKIHSRNTDSTLLSENGLHSVYIDNAGTFHVKDISQIGSTYETHAEQLFTTKNEIILRDGAIAGLDVGEYVGFRAKLYDGVNDGNLVFDKDGWARVGDVGALQKLATIEESPTNGYLMKYNTTTFRLESYDPLLLPVSTAATRQFVNQNGGTIYHITRWFTPTSALTIAANGLSATITSGQFTATMTGAKLRLTSGVNEPIITFVNSNNITLSYAVDASFFGQSVAVADWGVYSKGGWVGARGGETSFNITDIQGRALQQIDTLIISSYKSQMDSGGFNFNKDQYIRWTSATSIFGAYDLGIRRISAGLMEIYDGVTNGALRDLKLRSLFADKIIPNSDTTGVVIRNAADTADVVKVDTANGRLGINTTPNDILDVKTIGLGSIRIGGGDGRTISCFNNAGASANMNFASGVNFLGSMIGSIFTDTNTNKQSVRVSSTTVSLWTNLLQRLTITTDGLTGLLTTTPETTIDVNGTTTLRDWVYLNNGTHTGDALDDFRYKVLSGVLTFQKCTTANSVRGNGGWTTVSTI